MPNEELGSLAGPTLTDPLRTEDKHPSTREDMERGVSPLASSVDGRKFSFQASLHNLRLQTGGYVVLEDGDQQRLGQVLVLRPDTAAAVDIGVDGAVAGAR